MKSSYGAGIGLLAALALCMPTSSEACIHVVAFTKDDAVAAVARADRLLAQGRPATAYNVSRRARHRLEQHLRQSPRDAVTRALVERARRITALAVVRLDGNSPISARAARRGVVRGRQARSLGWALEQLRERAEAYPDDVRTRVHYAEALARTEGRRDEARAILVRLAEQDLMPDPHGYATLVRLTNPVTHRERWEHALTRCQQMASSRAEHICPRVSRPPGS